MKRGIAVLACVCALTGAVYFGLSKWGIRHETLNLFDAGRQRPVSVDLAVRRDDEMKADDGYWKLPVAIISNGNTVKNTEYSFLANVFLTLLQKDKYYARGLAAYYRSGCGKPPQHTTFATYNDRHYLFLHCDDCEDDGILAVYRIDNSGRLKRLKRWPSNIETIGHPYIRAVCMGKVGTMLLTA